MTGKAKNRHPLTRIVELLEKAVLVVLFVALVGLTCAQILLRNLFDSGIVWADDAIKILVLWVAMSGALYATRTARHISIDVISRFLPLHLARLLRRFLFVLTAAICAMAAWYCYQFVLLEFEDPTMAFLSLPTWFTQAVIPLTLLLMALRFLWLAVCLPEELESAAP